MRDTSDDELRTVACIKHHQCIQSTPRGALVGYAHRWMWEQYKEMWPRIGHWVCGEETASRADMTERYRTSPVRRHGQRPTG